MKVAVFWSDEMNVFPDVTSRVLLSVILSPASHIHTQMLYHILSGLLQAPYKCFFSILTESPRSLSPLLVTAGRRSDMTTLWRGWPAGRRTFRARLNTSCSTPIQSSRYKKMCIYIYYIFTRRSNNSFSSLKMNHNVQFYDCRSWTDGRSVWKMWLCHTIFHSWVFAAWVTPGGCCYGGFCSDHFHPGLKVVQTVRKKTKRCCQGAVEKTCRPSASSVLLSIAPVISLLPPPFLHSPLSNNILACQSHWLIVFFFFVFITRLESCHRTKETHLLGVLEGIQSLDFMKSVAEQPRHSN